MREKCRERERKLEICLEGGEPKRKRSYIYIVILRVRVRYRKIIRERATERVRAP